MHKPLHKTKLINIKTFADSADIGKEADRSAITKMEHVLKLAKRFPKKSLISVSTSSDIVRDVANAAIYIEGIMEYMANRSEQAVRSGQFRKMKDISEQTQKTYLRMDAIIRELRCVIDDEIILGNIVPELHKKWKTKEKNV